VLRVGDNVRINVTMKVGTIAERWSFGQRQPRPDPASGSEH
jgi:hypothetical protein